MLGEFALFRVLTDFRLAFPLQNCVKNLIMSGLTVIRVSRYMSFFLCLYLLLPSKVLTFRQTC